MLWLVISDQGNMHKCLVSKTKHNLEVSFSYCVLMMTKMWTWNCAQILCSDFWRLITQLSKILILLTS